MNDELDHLLKRHFSEDQPPQLPKNFSHLVRQQVLVQRLVRARRGALPEIGAVTLLVTILFGLLLLGLWAYAGQPVLQIYPPKMAATCALMLGLVLLLDMGLAARRDRGAGFLWQ